MNSIIEYRVAGWRIRQLDTLARRVLSALAAAEEAETRLAAICGGRRPAVFDKSHYHDEVGRARADLREDARRMAEWSIVGAATAMPPPEPANRESTAGSVDGGGENRARGSTA